MFVFKFAVLSIFVPVCSGFGIRSLLRPLTAKVAARLDLSSQIFSGVFQAHNIMLCHLSLAKNHPNWPLLCTAFITFGEGRMQGTFIESVSAHFLPPFTPGEWLDEKRFSRLCQHFPFFTAVVY